MEKKTFQLGMAKMLAAFSVEASPAKTAIYWEALADLPDAAFAAAVKRALMEWDKPFALPPIAVILRYAGDVAAQAGAVVDGASAWAYMTRHTLPRFRPGIASQVIDWPDQLARVIVREELGGIYALAVLEGEYALDQMRRRFIASYDRQRAVTASLPEPPASPALEDRRDLRLVSGDE